MKYSLAGIFDIIMPVGDACIFKIFYFTIFGDKHRAVKVFFDAGINHPVNPFYLGEGCVYNKEGDDKENGFHSSLVVNAAKIYKWCY